MAAPRSVQCIALRNLRQTTTRQPTRSLHMTGPATYASPFLSTHHTSNPTSLPSPNPAPSSSSPSRTFNTSRTLKSVNDSSPMDFAYLPTIMSLSGDEAFHSSMQIPILPSTDSATAMSRVEEAYAQLPPSGSMGQMMRPEISSVSSDSIILPLSDHASPGDEYMHIDFRGLAEKMAEKVEGKVEEQAGLVSRMWKGLVEDVVGKKEGGVKAV